MSYFSQWDLYGKRKDGKHLSEEQVDPLLKKLGDLADDWHSARPEGEYLCAFMTDYSSGYENVTGAVEEFSRAMADAVLCLHYHNTDTDMYQHIYFCNGIREEVDGSIAYGIPATIRYDAVSSQPWKAYCQYLKDWADSHSDPGFEGCCPSCYNEFLDGDWGSEVNDT